MVVLDGGAEEARPGSAALGEGALPSRIAASLCNRLARGSARLEHLTADLVGASAAAVGVPRRACDRAGVRARRLPRVRLQGADAIDRRARHVVQLRALAVRHTRLARRHGGPAGLLPGRHEHDRARHHPALGEPDDLRGPRDDGGDPVQRCRHPLDRACADRRAHVEEPRNRHEPARPDRRAWCGCDPLRLAEDGLVARRALLRRCDRRGTQARQQALERCSAHPASE